MTCEQLGGPCDFQLHGDTADAVIKAQDKHLNEIVSGGDATHKSSLKEMKGRWKHPLSRPGLDDLYGHASEGPAALGQMHDHQPDEHEAHVGVVGDPHVQ